MKKARKKRPGIYKDVKRQPINMQGPDALAEFERAAEKYVARLATPVGELVSQLRERLIESLKRSGCRVAESQEQERRLLQPGEHSSIIDTDRSVILPRDDYEPADDNEAARINQWRDAAVVLREYFNIDHQCSSEPYNLAYIVRSAFIAGQHSERLNIRPFERLVGIGREQAEKGEKLKAGRKQTAAENRPDLRREAEKAIAKAKRSHPSRSDEKEFIKKKAAESLGVTTRTIERRLGKSSDTT